MAHLTLDIDEIDEHFIESINSPNWLEATLRHVATETHATIIGVLRHQFQPQGATVLLLLSESHLSAHSWPERAQLRVDYYHCGQHARQRLEHAAELFIQTIPASKYKKTLFER